MISTTRTDAAGTPSPLKIVLLSPKGPLYRRRGGIFRQSLRYMPLTLPTLASLIPAELDVELTCVDEGIADIRLDMQADLIGITVITGTAPRAYELAAQFRKRGICVVLGGPHVTLVPDDAQPHADSIVVGYAEEEWPRLLRDFAAGRLRPRYTQAPSLGLADLPLPDRNVLPRWKYATRSVFEATRGCVHNCSFCVVPSAWGRRQLQKPVEQIVADIRREKSRRVIFVDLNLIADREYAARLFEALIPLRIQWYGLATTLLGDELPLLDLVARSGCRGLLMGFESLSANNLRTNHKRFNDPDQYPRLVELLHARRIALQGCFVFGLDDDTSRRVPQNGPLRRRSQDRPAALRHRDPLPRHRPLPAAGGGRPDPDAKLGTVRRTACRLSAGADERRGAATGQRGGVEACLSPHKYRTAIACDGRPVAGRPDDEPGVSLLCLPAAPVLYVRLDAEPRVAFVSAAPDRLGDRRGANIRATDRGSISVKAPAITPARRRPWRITIVHPCVGRFVGMRRYIRTWKMEPIPAAMIAALVPADVEKRFYDDRLEPIPFDEPTDLVAISVETYTARRAYQIASEYRRRGVPVVMGGFHATLCPAEVMQYSESIVIGEAESLLPEVIDDYRHGRPRRVYRSSHAARPWWSARIARSFAASDTSPFGWSSLPVVVVSNVIFAPSRPTLRPRIAIGPLIAWWKRYSV